MGSIRFLLAVAVVMSHSGLPWIMEGTVAVRIFYIISGFLISFILFEVKSYQSLKPFYINRILRIYPVFFVVLVLTTIAFLIANRDFFSPFEEVPLLTAISLMLTNLLVIGQDWVFFLAINNDVVSFTHDYSLSDPVLHKLLIMPHIWTIGLEATFYVIAPLFIRNLKLVFLFFGLSLLVKLYLYMTGLIYNDPWGYRFFPSELCLFILGALSHQFILPLLKTYSKEFVGVFAKFAVVFMLGLVIFHDFLPQSGLTTSLIFITFAVLLPLAFAFQNTYKLDRILGELSYPIYVCHILVLYVVTYFYRKFYAGMENAIYVNTALILVGTITVAVLLNKFVADPIEKYRTRVKSNQ